MDVAFPFAFDRTGRLAQADYQSHIRDMIEAVLFTSPGERVNRPTFGCGLLQMAFAPNSDTLASAAQFLVQAGLQQWLGDLIQVQSVQVDNLDSVLQVTVNYIIRQTQESQSARFSQGGTLL